LRVPPAADARAVVLRTERLGAAAVRRAFDALERRAFDAAERPADAERDVDERFDDFDAATLRDAARFAGLRAEPDARSRTHEGVLRPDHAEREEAFFLAGMGT
jgi:hypothetical protein